MTDKPSVSITPISCSKLIEKIERGAVILSLLILFSAAGDWRDYDELIPEKSMVHTLDLKTNYVKTTLQQIRAFYALKSKLASNNL